MKFRVELFRDYGLFKEFVEAQSGELEVHMTTGSSPSGDGWWAIVIVHAHES